MQVKTNASSKVSFLWARALKWTVAFCVPRQLFCFPVDGNIWRIGMNRDKTELDIWEVMPAEQASYLTGAKVKKE